MTRDDIIRMAAECGIPEFENNESQADNIIRFATLVAAAECNRTWTQAHWTEYERSIVAAERKRIISANAPEIERINEYIKTLEEAVAAERSACAQVCDEIANKPSNVVLGVALDCAAAIRARGER